MLAHISTYCPPLLANQNLLHKQSRSLSISHNNITSEQSVWPAKTKHLFKTKSQKKGVQIKVKQERPVSKLDRRRLLSSVLRFRWISIKMHLCTMESFGPSKHTHAHGVGSVLYTSQNKSSDLSRLKHLPLTYALENGTVDVDVDVDMDVPVLVRPTPAYTFLCGYTYVCMYIWAHPSPPPSPTSCGWPAK